MKPVSEKSSSGSQSQELRLRQLELEIQRQRDVIQQFESRLDSQDTALMSLRAYAMVMVATWHSDIAAGLAELLKQLNSSNADGKGWSVLKRNVDIAQGDFSRHIESGFPALTELETRVCLLVGMEMTTTEISKTLNISEQGVVKLYRDLQGKLGETDTARLRQIFHMA